jgi:hypothetical protein
LPLAPNVPEFRESAVLHRALLLGVLAEPETRALLLASRRVGDSLRPLCWMLGIEVSLLYPAAANLAPPTADAAATPAPSADDRGPNPVTDEICSPVVATRIVAAMEPIMRGVIEPSAGRARGRRFFRDGLSGSPYARAFHYVMVTNYRRRRFLAPLFPP